MSLAQLTFWAIAVAGSVALTAGFYPAVAKHSASQRDALLAAAMAGVLCALTSAFAISALTNAVVVVVLGSR